METGSSVPGKDRKRRERLVTLRWAVVFMAVCVTAGLVLQARPAHGATLYSGPCHAAVDKYWQKDRAFAHAVVARESRGFPSARNVRSGAAGCFQLMPQYYRKWMRSAGCNNVWDADCNAKTAWWLYSTAKQGRRPWRVR
jgi:hypothetical protein